MWKALLHGLAVAFVVLILVIWLSMKFGHKVLITQGPNQEMEMPKKQFDITQHFDRSTPGTHLYRCSADIASTAQVKNIYIGKNAFEGGKPPSKFRLIVEYDTDDVTG